MADEAAVQAELREAMEAGEALQGQLGNIEDQLQYLRALTQEYARARAALEALQGAKAGDEVLVPVGGGTFVRATLAQQDRVISSIGSNTSVEGPIPDALRRVEEQLTAAREASERLQQEGQRIVAQIQAIEQRLGQLSG